MKRFIAGCLLLAASATTNPLSDSAAQGIAIAGGVAAGLATAGVTHVASDGKTFLSLLVGGAAGCATWAILRAALASGTPSGKLAAFETAVSHALTQQHQALLFAEELAVDSQNGLIKTFNVRYGTSWPLVLARSEITAKHKQLRESRQALDIATEHLESYLGWTAPSTAQKSRAQSLLTDTRNALAFRSNAVEVFTGSVEYITSHAAYSAQCALYEQQQAEERRREHEARLERERLATQASIAAAEAAAKKDSEHRQRQHEAELARKEQEFKAQAAIHLSNRPGTATSINVKI